MRRQLSLLLGFICISLMAWAGEPWKEKPSTAWSDSDIQKILEDSPWSKTISVPASWLRTGAQGLETGVKVTIATPKNPTESPDAQVPPPVHDKIYNQYARIQVRWESSRTIRAALQLQTLRKGLPAASSGAKSAVGQDVDTDLSEYELLLIRDVLAPFPIASDSELKANTVLELKGTKNTVSPVRIRVQRRDDGQIQQVRFYFPKSTTGGRPSIPANEKIVEFQCTVGGLLLRARFEPSRMIDLRGPDLR